MVGLHNHLQSSIVLSPKEIGCTNNICQIKTSKNAPFANGIVYLHNGQNLYISLTLDYAIILVETGLDQTFCFVQSRWTHLENLNIHSCTTKTVFLWISFWILDVPVFISTADICIQPNP